MKYKKEIAGISIDVIKKSHLKNLYIRVVPPDGEVKVSAPTLWPDEEIWNFILKKTPEIMRAREKFRSQARQSKREYVSGESHYLWGKPYMLELVYGAKKTTVRKTSKKIILEVPDGADFKKRERAITEWYRNELKRVLATVTEKCERKTGLKANEYRIKNMKTRWGTCNIAKKRIWLNLQLVKKPMECLEYVIIHEQVHLLEKNHTHRFHSLVEQFYPEWKNARKMLSEMPLDYYEKDNHDVKEYDE